MMFCIVEFTTQNIYFENMRGTHDMAVLKRDANQKRKGDDQSSPFKSSTAITDIGAHIAP